MNSNDGKIPTQIQNGTTIATTDMPVKDLVLSSYQIIMDKI